MIRALKQIARAIAPAPVRSAWGTMYGDVKVRRARKAFDRRASERGTFLPADLLPALMRRGYRPPDVIRYDADGLVERAREKVGQIAARLPLDRIHACIELGCWDGMVLAQLRHRLPGVNAIGADCARDGIDARAREAGVHFLQTDAASLAVESESVDLLYSFAAFEHFADPHNVLAESRRVLRSGGYLYLMFGPVYTSPYGRHAYRQIPIPYCHYLFADADLRAYVEANGLPLKWPYVNEVTVTEYRRVFTEQSVGFDERYYREHPTGGVGAELIAEHPSCFRGKVPAFDDLLVSAIEVCWQKR